MSFEKYGEHWRYIYELEKEVNLWPRRRKAMILAMLAIFLAGIAVGGLIP